MKGGLKLSASAILLEGEVHEDINGAKQGNSPKRLGKDAKGNTIVHPPVSLDEHVAVQRENKVRTLLLQALPEDHMPDFHHYDDARDIWLAVKARFGGNEESKKMRKTMLKQQFTEFSVTEEEGLHKGYDRFQKILSQLNQVQARPDNDDINLKFLRALPSSWSQSVKAAVAPTYSVFIGTTCFCSKPTYSDQQHIVPSVSQTSGRSDNLMDCGFASLLLRKDHDQEMIMMTLDHKFEKKAGRKMNYNNQQPARFDRRKVRCYKCLQLGHFARECNVKTVDGKARYFAFKVTEVKSDEPKALVSVDSMINWSDHAADNKTGEVEKVYGMMAGLHADNGGVDASDAAAEFAMMGISPKVQNCPLGCDSKLTDLNNMYNNLDRLYNDCYIKVQAYQNAVKTLESQKDWYHKTQMALEEKIRVLTANLENTTNTLSYTETLHDQAGEMHAVPPSITGTYMPSPFKSDIEINHSDKSSDSATYAIYFVPCKSQAASVPAGSSNSSASVTADGPDPAASRNRPAVVSAGRPNPTERVKQPAGWSKRPCTVSVGGPVLRVGLFPDDGALLLRPQQVTLGGIKDHNFEGPRVMLDLINPHAFTINDPQGRLKPAFWPLVSQGGIVKFGGGDGRISGKGTIRTSKLDFENVYYVEELQHFNLFSVSQICDKKNKVLFTDTDCLVLSEEFQLPDASQVVLRIPRKHDLYTFHISDLQPEQKVTCLVAKASLDGIHSWHQKDGSCELLKNNQQVSLREGIRGTLAIKDPQQNGVAERQLHGCYVLTGVYYLFPHNKTPYELISGKVPQIGTQDHDSDSEVDEQVIVVPSFPSNSFAGPSSSNGPSVMERNADFAEELAKLQRQDLKLRTPACSIVIFDPAGIDSAFREPAGIVSADGVSTGSLSADSDPAGRNPADCFPPAGSFEPADESNSAVSSSVSADFNPVYADESTLLLGQTIGLKSSAQKSKFCEVLSLDIIQDQQRTNHTDQLHWTKWILKNKRDARGIVVRNKARLVAQGHRQEEGIDYDEVFAPVARIEAIRLFLAFASYMGFLVYQLDVKSAFLYGEIEEEVYVTQPKGFGDRLLPKHVYRVVKALYGLHQAPRACLDCDDFEGVVIGDLNECYGRDGLSYLGLQTATTPYEAAKTQLKAETDPPVNFVLVPDIKLLHDFSPNAVKKIFKWMSILGRRLISWHVQEADYCGLLLQTEAEYVVLLLAAWQDNQSTICIVKNPVFYQRTKHIEIRHHFIRDANEKNLIQVLKIHTDDNVADLLTKAFDVPRFAYLVVHIGMVDNTAARCTFFLLTGLVSAGSTMVLLVAILSAGRLVSAGSTMILLVVLLPAGCLVSAVILPVERNAMDYAADSVYMLVGILLLVDSFLLIGCMFLLSSWFLLAEYVHAAGAVYAANTSIHAAGLVCAGSIMFLLADFFLLVVTCFCCAQLDIAGWLVSATSHLVSAG
ncbi:ribonuclease H-like domain-containing protein [Tanacetum coccineum]